MRVMIENTKLPEAVEVARIQAAVEIIKNGIKGWDAREDMRELGRYAVEYLTELFRYGRRDNNISFEEESS